MSNAKLIAESDVNLITRMKRASNSGDVFLSLISLYKYLTTDAAQINFVEAIMTEDFLEDVKSKIGKGKTLYFLINTSGGWLNSSYKIAKALQNSFEKILTFVPNTAASGGTLLALTGEKIVMGPVSQLTPLDPQGQEGSPLALMRAYELITTFFNKLNESEKEKIYSHLNKEDNLRKLSTGLRSLELIEKYVIDILTCANYDKNIAKKIAKTITRGFLSHSEVIMKSKAKSMGINVKDSIDFPELWKISRTWLKKYIDDAQKKHIISYWIHE